MEIGGRDDAGPAGRATCACRGAIHRALGRLGAVVRTRRYTCLVSSVALIALALVFATHAGQVALKTVLLLPEAFSGPPARPLLWLTSPPNRETFELEYSIGRVEGDIYSPATTGRHGALILLLGARPLARDEPILVRFAEGLARTGAVVMVPASSRLSAGEVQPAEVDAVVEEIRLLQARGEVDPDRIGIVGFSVGGALGILAAADPRLAGQLAFVNCFGGYDDARNLVRAIATRSLAYAGVDRAWEPHPLTVWVVARQLVDTLPEAADRDLLDRVFLQDDPEARAQVELLSPAGRAVLDLLDGVTPDEVEAKLALLPAASQERLRTISPSQVLSEVHVPLLVMHDVADRFIPFTESRHLVERAPAGTVEIYTEFALFDHVVPDRDFDPGLLVELAKLGQQMYRVLLHVL